MKRLTFMTLLVALASVTAHAQLTDWQNISSKNFVMIIIHDENFLYVGTKGGGIVKIDKQSGQQTVLKSADGSMTGIPLPTLRYTTASYGLARSITAWQG